MSTLLVLLLAAAAPAQPVCVPAPGDSRVTECAVRSGSGAVVTFTCFRTETTKACL